MEPNPDHSALRNGRLDFSFSPETSLEQNCGTSAFSAKRRYRVFIKAQRRLWSKNAGHQHFPRKDDIGFSLKPREVSGAKIAEKQIFFDQNGLPLSPERSLEQKFRENREICYLFFFPIFCATCYRLQQQIKEIFRNHSFFIICNL